MPQGATPHVVNTFFFYIISNKKKVCIFQKYKIELNTAIIVFISLRKSDASHESNHDQ